MHGLLRVRAQGKRWAWKMASLWRESLILRALKFATEFGRPSNSFNNIEHLQVNVRTFILNFTDRRRLQMISSMRCTSESFVHLRILFPNP